MTHNLFLTSKMAVLAGLLVSIPSATAAFIPIAQPDSAYTSSTTLIPITGSDFDVTSSLSDANLTVTFSTPMEKFSVPTTWSTWGSPPAVEGSTPNVLSPQDFSITTVTLSFSQPVSTFGLEAEPDALTQGAFPVSLTFYNGVVVLGTVTRTLDGSSAALFAGSSDIPITSVVLSVAGNQADPAGTDPGLAQVRYALAAPASVPEPATWLAGVALAGLLGVRRFRSARS